MRIEELKNKWNGRSFVNNTYNITPEEKSYENDLKKTFEALAEENGAMLVDFSMNLDSVSGYVLKNGRFVYFTYLLPFDDMKINLDDSSWMRGIMVKRVHGLDDIIGGNAKYTNFDGFNKAVSKLTK